VMGLFDGASGRGELASTAHVAKLLAAPVVLVVDGSAMARSAAAIVHGFMSFDPELTVAGVVFNRVGSDGHEQLLREAVESLGIPVLGALRRNEEISAPERHLGLVPAREREPRAAAALTVLSAAIAHALDLEATERLARAAPELPGPTWSPEADAATPARIAIARGPAFSFHYEENLELLRGAGAEGAGALILAGGFPEIFGAELAANASLRAEVRALAAAGRPVLAECGGLLYLLDTLDGHPMCGVIGGDARMAGRLTLGYRDAEAATTTPWLAAGERVRGHEFHYSAAEPPATAAPAWQLSARGTTRPEGIVAGGVQASYLHVHWAATPELAARFTRAAAV
jgi:cobyrinic acid a,c-diamide synthase